jgi:hypothetical protein
VLCAFAGDALCFPRSTRRAQRFECTKLFASKRILGKENFSWGEVARNETSKAGSPHLARKGHKILSYAMSKKDRCAEEFLRFPCVLCACGMLCVSHEAREEHKDLSAQSLCDQRILRKENFS